MMTYEWYKWLHLVSLSLVLASLIGLLFLASGNKKPLSIIHGIGLFLLCLSGFGLLAKLGLHDFPSWVSGKLVIWGTLGASLAVIKRKKHEYLWQVFFGLIFLVGLGVYLAIFKP